MLPLQQAPERLIPWRNLRGATARSTQLLRKIFTKPLRSRMADILALLAGFGVIGIVLAVLAVWMR